MATETLFDYDDPSVGKVVIEEWDVCPVWCEHPDHDAPFTYPVTRVDGQVLWEAGNKRLIQVGERYFFTWYEDRGNRSPLMGTEELIVEDGKPVISENLGRLILWAYGVEALRRLAQVALVLDFAPDGELPAVEEPQCDIEKLQQVIGEAKDGQQRG